jgi:hypothetical protein
MPVYIIEIPGSDFTGVKAGVDFYQGKGSTSSLRDARVHQAQGASVADSEGKPVEIVSEINKDARVEILSAKAVEPRAETKVEGAPQGAPSATLHEPAQDAQAEAQGEPVKPKRGNPQARKRK